MSIQQRERNPDVDDFYPGDDSDTVYENEETGIEEPVRRDDAPIEEPPPDNEVDRSPRSVNS